MPGSATAVRERVEGEERGVRECESDSERLTLELDVGQEIYTRDSEPECRGVPRGASAASGEADHRQELDRGHGSERKPVDGDVETTFITRASRRARARPSTSFAIEPRKPPPWPSPEGEHGRSACDSEPGDAERLDPREKEHRERGPR